MTKSIEDICDLFNERASSPYRRTEIHLVFNRWSVTSLEANLPILPKISLAALRNVSCVGVYYSSERYSCCQWTVSACIRRQYWSSSSTAAAAATGHYVQFDVISDDDCWSVACVSLQYDDNARRSAQRRALSSYCRLTQSTDEQSSSLLTDDAVSTIRRQRTLLNRTAAWHRRQNPKPRALSYLSTDTSPSLISTLRYFAKTASFIVGKYCRAALPTRGRVNHCPVCRNN